MTRLVRSRCTGPNCGAPIVFVRSAVSDKTMVLDAESRKGVVLTHPPDADGEDRAKVVDVFTPHHASCPDVARFKRSKS